MLKYSAHNLCAVHSVVLSSIQYTNKMHGHLHKLKKQNDTFDF